MTFMVNGIILLNQIKCKDYLWTPPKFKNHIRTLTIEYLNKRSFNPAIAGLPETPPRMIVVIPSYNEPALLRSLQSLYQCRLPSCFAEVVVVMNHPENADRDAKRQNGENLREVQQFSKQHNNNRLQFHAIYKPDVP